MAGGRLAGKHGALLLFSFSAEITETVEDRAGAVKKVISRIWKKERNSEIFNREGDSGI